jgi:hypothetical protein
MLRSLRQRFHHQVPSITRGRLRHAMCRQIPEELRATWATIPGAKCSNDAIGKSAWKMNRPAGGCTRRKRGRVYDKERTTLCFALRVVGGVYNQGNTFEQVGWISSGICVSRTGTLYNDRRAYCAFGTLHISLRLLREKNCSPLAGLDFGDDLHC